MFQHLNIAWNLFDTVPNSMSDRPVTIIVVENSPAWANLPITPTEASEMSYFDAMGREMARQEIK